MDIRLTRKLSQYSINRFAGRAYCRRVSKRGAKARAIRFESFA